MELEDEPSEVIESTNHIYRGITYIINKWVLDISNFKYGYELISKDKYIGKILKLLKPLGIKFSTFLYDDAQHIDNAGQTDRQRVSYLHQQALKDINKLWDIYSDLFDIFTKRVKIILDNSKEFKEIMEIIE